MKAADCITLGYIGKAHGLDGELKASWDVQQIEDYPAGSKLYIQKRNEKKLIPFVLESIKAASKQYIIRLQGVTDRDTAETFSGSTIWYPVDELPDLGEKHFYYFELIGFSVRDESKGTLGKVKDFAEAGANDILIMDYQGKEILIPMQKEIVLSVDKESKVVNTRLPEGLLELYLE